MNVIVADEKVEGAVSDLCLVHVQGLDRIREQAVHGVISVVVKLRTVNKVMLANFANFANDDFASHLDLPLQNTDVGELCQLCELCQTILKVGIVGR